MRPGLRRLGAAAVLLGGPAAVLALWFVLPLSAFGPHHPALSWTTFVVALGLLAAALLREIWSELAGRPGHPVPVITLLISCALVVFATCYLALAQGGQFEGDLRTRIDALYFTVVTMATVGYGDISPSGQEARVVVMLQILYTFVFLTAGATSIGRRARDMVGRRIGQNRPPEQ